jgi:hypothetical protein
MTMSFSKPKLFGRLAIALGFVAAVALALAEDTVYKQPPKPVLEALKALPTPAISVSPRRDYAIFVQSVRYPSISEVAQPMLRLAGIRIDSNTNGMHLAANYSSFTIRKLSDGAEIKPSLPREAKLGRRSGVPTARSSRSRIRTAAALNCGLPAPVRDKPGGWKACISMEWCSEEPGRLNGWAITERSWFV